MSSPTKLSAIVTRNSVLRQLFSDAATADQINTKVTKLFPESLQHSIDFVNVNGDTLTITAKSSAWAARLRYAAPEVLQQLQQYNRFNNVCDVRIRVANRDREEQPRPVVRRARQPNAATSKIMREQAEFIGDAAIRNAVLKIANRETR